jgi:chemotaxis protein MotB
MADDSQRPIVVRRKKKKAHQHHGGQWKIAYADFVTAMMAFFLLMWLLGSTTSGDLKGIAEYFQTPLKIALQGGSGSGDSSHIIKGGGMDLSRSTGQHARTDMPSPRATISLQPGQAAAARAEAARAERMRLAELKQRIETAIEKDGILRQSRNQLLLDITSDGLRVQIIDEQNRPMFAIGRAELQPYARELLLEIARMLKGVQNKVSLSGHTDATPYAAGERSYSNWELSADRANASRRALIAGGMDEKQIVRVIGMASVVPLDKRDPTNAMNRRISLIVMNRDAQQVLERDGNVVNVGSHDDLKPETLETPG